MCGTAQRALLSPLPRLLLRRLRNGCGARLEATQAVVRIRDFGESLLAATALELTVPARRQWPYYSPRVFVLLLWVLTLVMCFAVGIMGIFQVGPSVPGSLARSSPRPADLARRARRDCSRVPRQRLVPQDGEGAREDVSKSIRPWAAPEPRRVLQCRAQRIVRHTFLPPWVDKTLMHSTVSQSLDHHSTPRRDPPDLGRLEVLEDSGLGGVRDGV